ncbi:MAG: hypothetical protein Q8J64_08750 [Thermodesulfovibrionales bacterium]|nr:hypothetical protein [Thermodesulfovibrionales bacterium]
MADVIYNAFKKNIANGNIDMDSHTIKVMLVTSAYAPNQDTHEFKSAITDEVVGAGYSPGGQELANHTVTQDNVNNRGVFDADDASWPGSTITARGAVIYRDTGDAGTSPLICYIDFGVDKTSSNGELLIEWQASGILNFN